MKNKLVTLSNNDGYEALYFKDLKQLEANPLEEGNERVLYFLFLCDNYGVDIKDCEFGHVCGDELPNRLSEVENNSIVWIS